MKLRDIFTYGKPIFADKLADTLAKISLIGNRKRAKVVIVVLSVCALLYAGGGFIYDTYFKVGCVTSLEDIPLSVQQSMTPEELNYFKTYGGACFPRYQFMEQANSK